MTRLEDWCFEWGRSNRTDIEDYFYYINLRPNWLKPELRYFGIQRIWYDCPHASFGFWWFNVGWSTPWTLPPPEFMMDEERAKWKRKPRWWKRLWCMEEYDDPA